MGSIGEVVLYLRQVDPPDALKTGVNSSRVVWRPINKLRKGALSSNHENGLVPLFLSPSRVLPREGSRVFASVSGFLARQTKQTRGNDNQSRSHYLVK
jgi:hypothetical protein